MPCICTRVNAAPCWRCEAAHTFLATAEGQEIARQWRLVERRWKAYQQAQAALVELSCRAFGADADMAPGVASDGPRRWYNLAPGHMPEDTRSWHVLKVLGMSNTRIATVWSKVRDAYDAAVSARQGGA